MITACGPQEKLERDISLGYLAGFIDGEGSIDLPRVRKERRCKGLCLRLRIGNTNLQSLKFLKKHFGGSLRKGSWCKKSTKQRYVLEWKQTTAKDLLRKVIPLLIIKRKQGLLSLKFPISRRRGGAPRKLTDREIELREEIRNSMIRLNGRRSHKKWML